MLIIDEKPNAVVKRGCLFVLTRLSSGRDETLKHSLCPCELRISLL